MKGKLCTEVTYMVQVRTCCKRRVRGYSVLWLLLHTHTHTHTHTQIDIGGLPATLVNFISRRQPLAVAYLRDYLESTTVSSYQPTDNEKEEEEEVQWDPVLFRK